MKRRESMHKSKEQQGLFKKFRYVITHLNLLGKITLGCITSAIAAGVVLAIVLPQNGMAASAQARDVQMAASEDVAAKSTANPTPSSTPIPSPSPTPTPSPSPTPTPDPTLQQGDESEKVQALQERLMNLGYMSLDESTLLYGPVTKYSVQLFQRQHDLQQDGIAGQETLEAIYSDEAKKYTLLEGMSGSDIDSLQRQLIDLGYMKSATGYYGTETIGAIEDFQSRNNLSVDGLTGEQTFELLFSPKALASADSIAKEKSRANILEMVKSAKAQIGDPYILGNQGPDSFDCSGLVYYVLKEAGSSRRRYNAAGYSKVEDWEKISSMNDMEIGDLIFFYNNERTKIGHVGIYVGGGMMVDASPSNGKVVLRPSDSSYWQSHFVLARRPW